MKRKYAGKILAAVMAVSLMVPATGVGVLAENKETTITYTVSEAYEWSVPATIEFTSSKKTVTHQAESGVKVTSCLIGAGKVLNIKIPSGATFQIKDNEGSGNNAMTYKVYKGTSTSDTELSAGSIVLSVSSGQTDSTAITYVLQDNPAYAGSYKGTLTYTSSVDNSI